LVTVIVTASDEDADYVDEALASVQGQTHEWLEILVVPHGQAVTIAERVAEQLPLDYRLRLDRRGSGSRAEARERGARLARGAYFCFLQGQDRLPPRAVELALASLETTGSDLAVGRLETAVTLSPSVLPPYDPVHATARPRTTLAEFPLAITDAALGNKLFRASFWRRAGLSFAEVSRGDAELAMVALHRADAFDVLPVPTYVDTNRAHGTPVEQLYDSTADLEEWLAGADATRRRLEGVGRELHDHWVVGVLDTQVQQFLADVERMSASQWAALRDFVASLTAQVDDRLWSLVRAESRVKTALLLDDRREPLEDFVAARWFERDNVRTVAVDGEVHAVLPFYDDPEVPVPASRFVMHPPETPARVHLRGVRTLGRDRLALDLLARIELLDLAGEQPTFAARLVPAGGEAAAPVDLPVAPAFDDQANMLIGHRYQDYRPGGCTVEVDLAALAGGIWQLEVTVSARGVTRSTDVVRLDRRASAGLLETRYQPYRHTSAGTKVQVDHDRQDHLLLRVKPGAAVTLRSLSFEGRTATIGLAGEASSVEAVCGRETVTAPVVDGRARLDLPRVSGGPWWWTLAAQTAGGPRSIAWPEGAEDPWLEVGNGSLVGARTRRGAVELYEAADTAVLDAVELATGTITVRGRWLGTAPVHARITLGGARARHTVPVVTGSEGAFTAVVPTRWDEWGLRETVVPTGEYLLTLSCGPVEAARAGDLVLSAAYVDSLRRFQLSDELRMRPVRTGRGQPAVFLAPPIPVEHAGAYAQQQLREACVDGMGPVDPSIVYFSVYAGSSATDSQLAIHEELVRTRPDLTIYWGVADASSWVPEGGTPVVFNTEQWYRVLSTAGYLVQNIDFDRWWRKRPGQRFLQTFHGYPAKSMGLRMWVAKNFTKRRLQDELDRTMAGWDLILTPTPEMDVHYRTEYAYEGEIFNQGYPRDDALVRPSAADDRERTRALLGIRPDQKVVLYAPTWRDHLALNYRSAKMVEHLDVVAASEALGDDYVILLRGHRFNSKGSERRARTAQIVDVTDYPEINDLILASDAAVLDYSSLRFDFALTRRPMVFLVPDLADYTGGIRGFLFDYADTAPGPMLETAEEVVEALGDLDALTAAYADRIAAFNEKYLYTMDGKAAERVVQEFFDRP